MPPHKGVIAMAQEIDKMIKRKGADKYMIVVPAEHTTTGKRERICGQNGKAFDSKAWAESVCLDMLVSIKNGRKIDPAFFVKGRAGKYIFNDVVMLWLKKKDGLAPTSIRYYESVVKALMPFWGGKDMRDITPWDTDRFLQSMTQSKSHKNHIIGVLNNLFRYANKVHGLKLEMVERLKEDSKRKEAVDMATWRLILGRVPDEHRAIVQTYFYTGMRSCEVRAVRKSWVDLQAKTIHVREHWSDEVLLPGTKEGGDKVIRFDLLHDLTPVLMAECSKVGKDDFLFQRNGKPYPAWKLFRVVKDASRGIVDLTPHHIARSTAVSMMIDVYGLRIAMQQVGHGDMQTTNLYNQVSDLSKVAPKLELVSQTNSDTGMTLDDNPEKKVQ
jgi:integrase